MNSCSKSKVIQKDVENSSADLQVDKDSENNCDVKDIVFLNQNEGHKSFIKTLDSTVQKQYPAGKEITSPELNTEILTQFLNDLNLENFDETFKFQKKYNLKLTPKSVQTLNEINIIELVYYPKECSYRLSINCSYETEDYSDESSVIYFFKIVDGKLKDFARQEAG